MKKSPYVRVIQGITFINTVALEASVAKNIPVKYHLRQKMINAGVEFWDEEQTIVKKPVIGISAIGSFNVSFDDNVPSHQIKLFESNVGIEKILEHLKKQMGMQSTHTYQNPGAKTPDELYELTSKHGHWSMAHAVSLEIICLGISKIAEMEFDVQRDGVNLLARTTSARSDCQNDPCLVALSEKSAVLSKKVLQSTQEILKDFTGEKESLVYKEQRNGLFPSTACVSLGITGTLRDFSRLVLAINDNGKEIEFRNALALINDSLHAFFPDLYKHSSTYNYSYPDIWQIQEPNFVASKRPLLSIFNTESSQVKKFKILQFKETILLLGAPGIGKSTQTVQIKQQRQGVMCISTGELVRKLSEKQKRAVTLTKIEQEAVKSLDKMRTGELMDDHAVYNLLIEHVSPGGEGYEEYCKAHTVILDGVVKAERNITPFHATLSKFNSNPEELKKRHQTRITLAKQTSQTPRPDDDNKVYAQRLEKYYASMHAVFDYYRQHYNFTDIHTDQGIEQTMHAILECIDYKALHNEEHMLVNTKAYKELLERYDLSKSIVIEFGAGDGALTELIFSAQPKKVIAYELNKVLAEKLKKRFNNNALLEIRVADFTKEDFSYLKNNSYVIISNPPYSTIPFLFKVINAFKIENVILMCSPRKKEQYFQDYQLEFILDGEGFTPQARGEHLVIRKGFQEFLKNLAPVMN